MNSSIKKRIWGVGFVASCIIAPAYAQIAPPSNPIDRIIERPQPKAAPPLETPAPAEAPIVEGPAVKIARVEIVGGTVYSQADIAAVLTGISAGATVKTGQIQEAVRNIQAKYRADGYFLTVASAKLTKQADGVLVRIEITEGYISAVKIDGDIGPVAALIYGYLDHLVSHLPNVHPVRYADIERYALLAQNVPGVSIRTVLRPGEEVGSAELVAMVTRKRFSALLVDDNRGPRTAGPNQMLVGFSANSFTSLGEQTNVLIYDTPFNDEQAFGEASVEAFLGSDGFKAKVYTGYGVAEPGDVLAAAGYKSRLLLAGGSGTYPVIRSRDLSLYVSGAFDLEQSEIDLRGFDGEHHRQSNSHLRVLRLAVDMDNQDAWFGSQFAGGNKATLTVSRGVPELGGDSNGAPDPARPDERNDFLTIKTELSRQQRLYSWDTDNLELKLAFAGQWTNDILPPVEKFFLGGNDFGRGFYSGEVTGDRVAAGTIEFQFNDEVKTAFWGEAFDLAFQYYSFFDIGQTWDLAPGDPSHHLESVGVGVRLQVTENVALQLEGVHRFTLRPDGGDFVSRETQEAGFFSVKARY